MNGENDQVYSLKKEVLMKMGGFLLKEGAHEQH
jgi:hypothetical protein